MTRIVTTGSEEAVGQLVLDWDALSQATDSGRPVEGWFFCYQAREEGAGRADTRREGREGEGWFFCCRARGEAGWGMGEKMEGGSRILHTC